MQHFAQALSGRRLSRRTISFSIAALFLLSLAIPLLPGMVKAGVNHWTPLVNPSSMNATALAVSPAYPCDRTVFIATDGFGVFRTVEGDNEDATWYPINAGLADISISSLVISPNYNRCDRAAQFNRGDNTLFVGTRTGLLYKSIDSGATWNATTNGLPTGSFSISAIGISPNYASDRVLFVALQSSADGGPNAVYRTTDAGASWLPFDAGLTDRTVQAFAISANYANDATLFVGTRFSGVYRFAGTLSGPSVIPGTINRGANWTASASGLASPFVRTITLSPSYPNDRTIYAGTTAGAYRSTNNGGGWGILGANGDDLSIVDFTGLAITQGSPRTIYGSTGGRGIWQFTESNGGSLSDIKLTEAELAHHIPGLPFHTFLPYTTKNRLNGTC